MSGKWLELLKEVSPSIKKVAVLQDPIAGSSSVGQFAAIQSITLALNVDLVSIILRDDGQIDKAITAFGQSPDAGLIATRTAATIRHLNLIVTLAARLRLPTIYPLRSFVVGGGLIAYGADIASNIGEPPPTLTASSKARSQPICRSSADQIRARDQPQNRQSARARRAAAAARPRRRGDRIAMLFAAVHMSLWHLADIEARPLLVAFGGIADIAQTEADMSAFDP